EGRAVGRDPVRVGPATAGSTRTGTGSRRDAERNRLRLLGCPAAWSSRVVDRPGCVGAACARVQRAHTDGPTGRRGGVSVGARRVVEVELSVRAVPLDDVFGASAEGFAGRTR